jgi:maltose alpha-D-glucosyltransferase/alpha-amylase
MKRGARRRAPSARPADWYKDAIVYELRVRSFADDDGDGIGDLQGLTGKLDYLADLGVTALWLLPFYPSPLRDDGYDISDYVAIHPDMGTLADFERFLEAAHERGLAVITELVLNHTSDQHPWFQRARRAPIGSPERDFYVFSDTPERYRDARIIFQDYEPSNWTWDPVARAYYWHRFYAHQPDLNFDNPAVQAALFEVCDRWLEMGVDGLRLDAVPYLFEREGTSCENLAETHAFLKELRRHVDERFPGRMLLAEANQWPEEAAAYFGRDDECHMAFHFPIMPRLFMAIHAEDRFPIVDVLAQTPTIPEGCQWALFLRNHDELTLEMVTDEERDSMFRAYARDPAMRHNLGIRRRLAPLLGNDRRKIELMNGLLFSLPGTPVLYYGDEIGMGDNVFLGDRHGVRTPMQWSSDRNAGFSRANPQRLVSPVIIDPEYHFEAVNVEAQQGSGSSLLWWTKRLIALRKRFRAFGRGGVEILGPDNPKVLAFLRVFEGETILVVANLARSVEYVELDLSRYRGRVPVELFGGNAFPAVGDLPYLLTLGGHAFYWFSLEEPARIGIGAEEVGSSATRTPIERTRPAPAFTPPVVEAAAAGEAVLGGADAGALADAVAGYLDAQRRVDGRVSRARTAQLVDAVRLGEGDGAIHWVIVDVEPERGDPERVALPAAFVAGERAAEVRILAPGSIVLELRGPVPGLILDATIEATACSALVTGLLQRRRGRGAVGAIASWTVGAPPLDLVPAEHRVLRLDAQHAVVAFGDRVVLRLLRRLDEAPSPHLEIGRFLLRRRELAPVAPLLGAIELYPLRGAAVTLAVLDAFVPNEGDGLSRTIESLGLYFERALTRPKTEPAVAPPARPVAQLAREPVPADAAAVLGMYLDRAELLGRRTADLHRALADDAGDPAFAPEPYSPFDQRGFYQTRRGEVGRALDALRSARRRLAGGAVVRADAVLARGPELLARFGVILDRRLTALRTRVHGDYRLGEILFTGNDFVVPDLGGDRRLPASSRRRKVTPLRDVATLLRSLRDAATTALLDETRVRKEDREAASVWAEIWCAWVSAAVVRGWIEGSAGASYLPTEPRELDLLLDVFSLEQELSALGDARRASSPRTALLLDRLVRALDQKP